MVANRNIKVPLCEKPLFIDFKHEDQKYKNYLDINNLKKLRMLKTGNVLVVKSKATRCLGGGWRA
jgi:hypothetical protein